MFKKTKSEDVVAFEAAKTHLLRSFTDDEMSPEEFTKVLAEFNKLAALYHADQRDRRVSADVLAGIGGNILGIILILQHERAHVVASKAIGFVQKLR